MTAAEGSRKTSVEDQDDVFVSSVVGEAHPSAPKIIQAEIRSGRVDLHLSHLFLPLRVLRKSVQKIGHCLQKGLWALLLGYVAADREYR
jgi:hypothetical protein